MQKVDRDRQVHLAAEQAVLWADPDDGLPLDPAPARTQARGALVTVGIVSALVCFGVAFRAVLAAW